jgi:hypothetical protein
MGTYFRGSCEKERSEDWLASPVALRVIFHIPSTSVVDYFLKVGHVSAHKVQQVLSNCKCSVR